MKQLLKIIIIVGLFAVGYQYRYELHQNLAPYVASVEQTLHITPAPCTQPIPYNLGTFDNRFGISKDYFLSALVEAEAVWEKPYGKNLFEYVPRNTNPSDLKINLVYDYRQEATSKLNSLGIAVADDRASYDGLKAKLDTLKSQYQTEQADYNARVDAFNRGHRSDVTEFNNLETERKNLNAKVDEINALVVVVNRLIGTLNLSVNQYNTTSTARGESFEEGVYTTDGSTSGIDIYEFSNRQKLVRVLAHELGHALGLDHVKDPKAIMYELNQGNNETLTEADMAELRLHCTAK